MDIVDVQRLAQALSSFILLVCVALVQASVPGKAATNETYSIRIERKSKRISVFDSSGKVVLRGPVGIGKGGLLGKRNMADLVTPTGNFVVNIVLSNDQRQVKISPELRNKYKSDKAYADFLNSPEGLVRMFNNMSSLDFDGDGKGDTAYGAGYVGLALSPSAGSAVKRRASSIVGPGARVYQGKVSWYSIAIHGTPNPERALGKATSGGCVHVDAKNLKTLLDIVPLGTSVSITD